ncbi:hypothetical protein DRJ17_07515 [Candidatus Woesearchaeota archaeon]|nr:MAG: hypothetical protein DRJ17_07515 [Candidatus Woesearchaeota archaeon]
MSSPTGVWACAAGESDQGQRKGIGEWETARDRGTTCPGWGWWLQGNAFLESGWAAGGMQMRSEWSWRVNERVGASERRC